MTITILEVVDAAANELEDPDYERFSYADWVKYCNRAIEDVCRFKPDAYTTRVNVQLEPGTVQSLPSNAMQLIRPTRNMGEAGTIAGRGIRMMALDAQNGFNPDWHSDAVGTEVDDVFYDPTHPLEFWVSPAVPYNYIELICAAIPTAVTISSNLPVRDIYRNPVLYFMLGHALHGNRADTDFARGQAYLDLAYSALGIQSKGRDEMAVRTKQ